MAQMTEEQTQGPVSLRRLRFSDELESSFSEYRFEQSLTFARFAIVLSIVLYALFGILDRLLVPAVAQWIWVIRYAIFCPIALAVLGLTFTRWFKPIMQPVLAALAAVCGLGIVAMVAIINGSGGYLYYAGLLLVIPWAYTLLQLRFSSATRACVVIMAGYEFVAIWLRPTPTEILVSNNFFFLSSVIIGMVAGYTIERGLRTDFLQRRLIETQRAELAEHNVQLDSALRRSLEEVRQKAEDLQISRVRIVTAADAERRRIERNLHDGAQQQLVALAVKVRLARQVGSRDPVKAGELLEETEREAVEALENLRDLARGIYPPLLAERGLVDALVAHAAKGSVTVEVQAENIRRYPQEIEAAVYFCVLEALQNVAKYANTDSALVSVQERGGWLRFTVTDDGMGFDPAERDTGSGLQGMADRLAALGGEVRVTSAAGEGTVVQGQLPTPVAARAIPGTTETFARPSQESRPTSAARH
jgi:signal transduction histidine kinase